MFSKKKTFQFPGTRSAMDGNTAVIMCERESTDAAGAYPITPSTQMGEYWAESAAKGHINISGRPLIFIEPEGEHAAAAVTAGLSMTGLRAANFSSGQGIAYMHESLYAAVGKRLTYVLNIGARAMTKSTLNVHAGHDDYHCVDDTGFFQLFGKNAQEVCDLNIIAHKIAELSLTPGIVAQDGFLTTHLIESMLQPERELIEAFLGHPDDIIKTPTPAQKLIYGEERRRIPEVWTVDNPMMAGIVQNQDAYMQSVAAQRPYFFDHIEEITNQCMDEFYELTGRQYARIQTYNIKDADYLILGQGSVIPSAEAVADYLKKTRKLKIGVVNMTMFRPFPGQLLAEILKGRKGVVVLERIDQPLAEDLPLIREIRAALGKSMENGRSPKKPPYPNYPTYKSMEDAPPLYSGSFGMGSRDLQPEGIIGAIENMLPDGARKKLFYLSIDFIREAARTPKQEIHQQDVAQAYPHVKELAIRGSENPNLMPDNCITIRFHSVGGWGAITTGKNLAMTLFDLLGYHIKANPKYGSEKKGQPTTYYLSAAPEPIRINCEYFYVDIVMSPDPKVFSHTNALAGLREGGTFIIQSDLPSPDQVWADIPKSFRKIIVEKNIRIFYLDAFKIAREEASDVELQFRMQGNAFQGAFFAASPVAANNGLDEESLVSAIRAQLQQKFGGKGARVVEDNVRVVKRGYDEIHEIMEKPIDLDHVDAGYVEPPIPVMLKQQPQSEDPLSDPHRFWEQTGNFYIKGMGNDNITDPFIGLSVIPAVTGVYRDMTGIRYDHPIWDPQKCTACGSCYTVCPDTAIPGLVNEFSQVLETAVKRVKNKGHHPTLLSGAIRKLEGNLRARLNEGDMSTPVNDCLNAAIQTTIENSSEEDREQLTTEFQWFNQAMGDFQLAVSRPYFGVKEKKNPGSGGLLSITVNPYTCKGCAECVQVCNDDALVMVPQTAKTVKKLQDDWNFWLDLPNTPKDYIRIDNIDEGIGALETLLLNKDAYLSLASGDGACLGCSEKTVVHLFTATVETLMQPRVEKHVTHINDLIARLEKHIQTKLMGNLNVGDPEVMNRIVDELGSEDLTLAAIARKMDGMNGSKPVDQGWMRRVTKLISKLKNLKWQYSNGTTGRGRSKMGILNSTGCTSVWGSTYPFNPYPFPWANHLFQDSASLAMGIFEGHMSKMADGFKAIRHAELELAGEYKPHVHDPFFTYFTWEDFSDEEFLLCPPVVALGGDGAMYDIGFQNLSRALMSAKPIKVLILDTQVYSNTGGQACTSGFPGQISDMAQFGKVTQGKMEIRKEMSLIAIAHRTSYVLQGVTAAPNHMIEGFIQGLNAKRPAVFNIFTSCQPEHGIGDDMGAYQAKLAMESRAYPLLRYHPDKGESLSECLDLDGNPAMNESWPTYTLEYVDGGLKKTMDVAMTFADFAITEGRFRKHFRKAPRDTWNKNMIPIADFLEMDEAEREGKYPFIWTVDKKQTLGRVMVAQRIVEACEERLHFWNMLKEMAAVDRETPETGITAIEERVRMEVVGKITAGLMELAGGNASSLLSMPQTTTATPEAAPQPAGQGMAPWLDTDECTSCDECIKINPEIFTYNESKKAYIKNPTGGPYQDLVKAAEKCTAQVIHPGLPADTSAPDTEKWVARAEKYN